MSSKKPCGGCGKPVSARCARCKHVTYCSAACQRRDWKQHRRLCNELASAVQQMADAKKAVRDAQQSVSKLQSRREAAAREAEAAEKAKERASKRVEQDAASIAKGLDEDEGGSGARSGPAYADPAFWEDRYRKDQGEYEWYCTSENVAAVLRQVCPCSEPVLELGCGTSFLALDLHERGWGHILAIDSSDSAIRAQEAEAKRRGVSGASFRCLDATATELPPCSFSCVVEKGAVDAILSGERQRATEAVDTVRRMSAEVGRVLRPGGAFLVISSVGREVYGPLFEGMGWGVERTVPIEASYGAPPAAGGDPDGAARTAVHLYVLRDQGAASGAQVAASEPAVPAGNAESEELAEAAKGEGEHPHDAAERSRRDEAQARGAAMTSRITVLAGDGKEGSGPRHGPRPVDAGAPVRVDLILAGGTVQERDFVALFPSPEEARRDPHSAPDFEFVPAEAVGRRACSVNLRAPAKPGPYVAVYVAEEAAVAAAAESIPDAARVRVAPAPAPTYLLELHRGRDAYVLTARAPEGARGELSCTLQPWRVVLRALSPHGVPTVRTVHLPVPCDPRRGRVGRLEGGRCVRASLPLHQFPGEAPHPPQSWREEYEDSPSRGVLPLSRVVCERWAGAGDRAGAAEEEAGKAGREQAQRPAWRRAAAYWNVPRREETLPSGPELGVGLAEGSASPWRGAGCRFCGAGILRSDAACRPVPLPHRHAADTLAEMGMCEGMPAPFFARGPDASHHVPDGALAVGAGHVVVHRAALEEAAVEAAEAAGPVASGGETREEVPPLWVPWPVGDGAENDEHAAAQDVERAAAGSDAAYSRQRAAVDSAYQRAAAWDPRQQGGGGDGASAAAAGPNPAEADAPPSPAAHAASAPASAACVLRCARCDTALGFADSSGAVALLKESLQPGDAADARFRRALGAYGPGARLAAALAERAAEGQMAFLLLPAEEVVGAAGVDGSGGEALEIVVMASEAVVQLALEGAESWVERHGVRVMWRHASPQAARRWARERDAQERRVLDEELTQVGAMLSRTTGAMAADARSIGGFSVGCMLG